MAEKKKKNISKPKKKIDKFKVLEKERDEYKIFFLGLDIFFFFFSAIYY